MMIFFGVDASTTFVIHLQKKSPKTIADQLTLVADRIDIDPGPVLEQCAADYESIKVSGVNKPFIVAATITKTMPPYHMPA